ncbi:recombinase family protein [Pseudobacteriovorax antillogorgiicola]|uniref:Site-specific DNA recombinase n=1 Tax=Pseudobacteriovorax antillogorgiicola TaxID=1513793 RepID=A0A1Y6BX35_9BACT|nr:recombinase family protein [Pseudobacteriovorax antillogorgiicola]TCS53146.1 DNA invertase Pin-like site-specific DNA recombinase [Pseudobacteriovorax antillogorgiicola]SMF25214.1 Site-specific DNA recombinase [Pseudobacteriovorax antillogorgiicola]
MKSIGIYYRVSTDKQDLASQQNAVETWLKSLPTERQPKSIKVFKDQGISGKTNNRPGYQKLLKTAFEQKIDTIIVYRLDRMSRNATDAIQTLLTLDQAGVAFISVTQPVLNLGHENPFRRTMLAAFSEIAEIERETIVARVKSGLDAAKKRGVRLGRPSKLTKDAQLRARKLRSTGLSYKEIAEETGLSNGTVQTLIKGPDIEA